MKTKPNPKLAKAKQALADFLKLHPELIPMQLKIEETLKMAVTPGSRMEVLTELIKGKQEEMVKACEKLKESLDEMVNGYKMILEKEGK